jgi:hypothetical protein
MQGVSEKSGEKSKYKVRNISVSCTSRPDCSEGDAHNNLLYVLYTTDECGSFGLSTPVIAQATKKIKCREGLCAVKVNNFKMNNSHENLTHLPQGTYTLVSFVDMNDNESLDLGEPFFCSENIEISVMESLKEVFIEMKINY